MRSSVRMKASTGCRDALQSVEPPDFSGKQPDPAAKPIVREIAGFSCREKCADRARF
jgi:hypothetical protein